MRSTYLFAAGLTSLLLGCGAGGDPQSPTSVNNAGAGGDDGGGGRSSSDGGGDGDKSVAISVGTGTFGEGCGRNTTGALVPASILIVLDKSGSMGPGENGEPDKWGPTRTALTALTTTAPQQLLMGLLPFPGDTCNPLSAGLTDGCCTDVSPSPAVQIKPLATSGPEIVTWLNSHGPTEGTPTYSALQRGYNILKTLTTQGERFLLLVTDGAPQVYQEVPGFGTVNQSCGTLEDMVATTSAAATSDPVVKTFVIGAPGSEGAAEFFGQIQTAGLTAPNGYFRIGSANYAEDLAEAFAAITGQVSDCVFALPAGEDVDPTKVNVVVTTADGQEVEIFRDEAHVDGWDYTDPSQTKLQLFGPACELYKSAAQNTITIVLGCETVVR